MEVAPTFGAVGDFISIALLIKDIIVALDECRGSSKAYRDLVEEINLLQENLDHVERVYQGSELADGFESPRLIAQATIARIRKCLEDFCCRVCKKYAESLAEGGSGNIFKDVTRKIQWKFKEKEVEQFRSEVMGYRMSLEMFLQVTTVCLVQNTHRAVSKQLSRVETNTINSVRQYGQSIENYLRFLAICIFARLHFISKLGTDIKQTATQTLTMMLAVSGELGIIRAFIMQLDRGIDNGEHFVLEDATGRSFPIHLMTIVSWEAFDIILTDRFRGKKGERRTRRKLYSLHESTSHLEIDRSVAFGDAFVPNQKVDMSLNCKAPDALTTSNGDIGLSSCPWCRVASPGQLGARLQCINCKRGFVRIVIEVDDVANNPFVPSASRSEELHHAQQLSLKTKTLALQNAEKDTKKRQTGSQKLDAESESDEENLTGLSHVTLQTRRMRLSFAKSHDLPRAFGLRSMDHSPAKDTSTHSSMLSKLNRRSNLSASVNDMPAPRLNHPHPGTIFLPHRTKQQPFLDTSLTRSLARMSAVWPSSQFSPRGVHYRSPLGSEIGDFERLPVPRTRWADSSSASDDASTQASYDMRNDETDFLMNTSRMRTLNIEEQWRERESDRDREMESSQAGQKRRASSPPSDIIPLASNGVSRKEGRLLTNGSPTPRLTILPQSSSISTLSSVSRSGMVAAKMKGPYMCECCPKKPKKFELEEELKIHEAEKQYECPFCGDRFKNKNEAERHQNSLHVRRHSWSCSALTGYERALHDSTIRPGEADTCGYCGDEFPRSGRNIDGSYITDEDWEGRIRHLQDVHKFRECNSSKKFYRADHFRRHLRHSHAGTLGKWTNMLETACMLEEDLPVASRRV